MDSQRGESFEDLYRSVFTPADKRPIELPAREGKGYALTAAVFDQKRLALVKTIASIANRTAEIGYIVCQGGSTEDPQVDPAIVDDAVRALVYPHVQINLRRDRVDNRVVDIIAIGPNRNRPHLMRNSAGEMVVPFRGAANNITAGRHDIDAMYEERQIGLFRREMARLSSDISDSTDEFLAQNDWGGLSETSDAEFLFAIVPKPIVGTPLVSLESSRDRHAILHAAIQQTIAADGDSDWLTMRGDFVSGVRDGYLEGYQPARDNHRLGTIRIYDVGAIIVRIWILEPFIDGQNIYSFLHFRTALRASLRFAWRLYTATSFPSDSVDVRCALANAQDLDLWMTPSASPRLVLPNKDVGRRLYLPSRPIVLDPRDLEDQAADIADRVSLALKTHYGG